MSKTVWFLNHYSQPIEYYPHERTYQYAKNLKKYGYNPIIFCASKVHNSPVNLLRRGTKFQKIIANEVEHYIIRTNDYNGNGIKRILNMAGYTFRILMNFTKFEKPDIIIATSVHPFACYAGIRIAKKLNIKCIIEIADLWPESIIEYGIASKQNPFVVLLYWLEKYIYKKSDYIIFTMEGGIDYIKNNTNYVKNIDLKKVYHINNGVDIEKFDSNKITYEYENGDYNNNRMFKVVYTGSLGIANQVELILETAKIIQSQNPNVIFYIFGDGSERFKLESFIDKNNIKNVRLMGKIDKKYIPNILSKSNLNILILKDLSILKYGTSLNKMLEYAASSKPILTNKETSYDLIKKYNSGIIARNNDAMSLSIEIQRIYNMDIDEYNLICLNARNMAINNDYTKNSNKLIKIIELALNQNI